MSEVHFLQQPRNGAHQSLLINTKNPMLGLDATLSDSACFLLGSRCCLVPSPQLSSLSPSRCEWSGSSAPLRLVIKRSLVTSSGDISATLLWNRSKDWERCPGVHPGSGVPSLDACQEEVGPIWETLREDSRKIRFQGSLFDLCAPSSSPFLRASLTTLPLPLLARLIMSVAAYAWSGLVSRPPVPPPSADPDLFTLYSPLSTKIVKPRISLSNLMFVNQTLLTSLISTRLTS
jgi:hypothetical protein